MVVNITTIHFHYHVVTIHGSDVHFNSGDVRYSVFTDLFLADLLSDIVVLDLNMFGFSMGLWVFRHTDCCLIVFIHDGRY